MADPKFAEALKTLAEQLGGRPAVLINVPQLAVGTFLWDVDLLPKVFASPDVFEALSKCLQDEP